MVSLSFGNKKLNRYALGALIAFLLQFVVPLFKPLIYALGPFMWPFGTILLHTDFGSPLLFIIAFILAKRALREINPAQETGKIMSWIILLLTLVQIAIFIIMFITSGA